jgi:hypothetical protein
VRQTVPRPCALALLLVGVAGCLDVPGPETDQVCSCGCQVGEDFDTSRDDLATRWKLVQPTGTQIDESAGLLDVTATGTDLVPQAFASVGSDVHRRIAGTTLTAKIDLEASGPPSCAGIDLLDDNGRGVALERHSDGVLHASIYTTPGNEQNLCDPGCPFYSPVEDAYLRIRVDAGATVHWESSSDGQVWTSVYVGSGDLGIPMGAAVVVYAGQAGTSASAGVDWLRWADCDLGPGGGG